jgi:hypothetical protein
MVSDPVGGGLVASLAQPGGNVTGLSTQFTDLASKRHWLSCPMDSSRVPCWRWPRFGNGPHRCHRKDDRDERCRLLCREDCTSRRDNDIDLEPDKLGRDFGHYDRLPELATDLSGAKVIMGGEERWTSAILLKPYNARRQSPNT